MFCPSCGANLADNAKFCNSCGAALVSQEAPTSPQQPTPSVAPYMTQPTYQEPKVGKLKFLAKLASKGAKTSNLISWIVCVVCVALLTYSFVTFYFSPVYDWFFLEIVSPEDTDQLKDTFDEAQEEYEMYREEIEDLDDDELMEELEEYLNTSIDDDINFKKLLKRMDAVMETPSLSNMSSFINMFEDFDSDIWGEDMDEMVLEIFDIILKVIVIVYVVLVLLTILVTLFKRTGLVVLAQFFSVIYVLLCVGLVPAVILAIAYIVLAVFCSIINKEYKAYRKAI